VPQTDSLSASITRSSISGFGLKIHQAFG